jgi:hypothetical protein
VARKKSIFPLFSSHSFVKLSLLLLVFGGIGAYIDYFVSLSAFTFFVVVIIFNGLFVLSSFSVIKKIAK